MDAHFFSPVSWTLSLIAAVAIGDGNCFSKRKGCSSDYSPPLSEDASSSSTSSPTQNASQETHPPASLHWKGAYQSDRSESAPLATHELPSSQEAGVLPWKKEEEDAGLGEGTIDIQVDTTSHTVKGTLSAPLGPATLVGTWQEGHFCGQVTPESTTPPLFYGTLCGDQEKDQLKGWMRLSSHEGALHRYGHFQISPSSPNKTAP